MIHGIHICPHELAIIVQFYEAFIMYATHVKHIVTNKFSKDCELCND